MIFNSKRRSQGFLSEPNNQLYDHGIAVEQYVYCIYWVLKVHVLVQHI